MTLIERAVRDLTLVAAHWADLAESRHPGTPRPYREPALTPERRAELDHLARLEWAERAGDAPGEHGDAVRVDVLDLMSSLLIDADECAEIIARAIMCPRLPYPATHFADPGPYLAFAATHLPACAAQNPSATFYVAEVAERMAAEISRALSLLSDGQRLKVVCPWCGGGLTGAHTWRVRQLPGDQIAIVCESQLCEPPSKDVGTWWHGRPCWPMREWDWLSKRVTANEDPQAKRKPEPSTT